MHLYYVWQCWRFLSSGKAVKLMKIELSPKPMPSFAFSTSIPWSISKSLPSRSLSLWLLLVLLFHYSTHFVQHISTTGCKTASQHNATTTMSKADGAFLRLKASTLLLKNSLPLCPNNSHFFALFDQVRIKSFFLACPCEQLQISV